MNADDLIMISVDDHVCEPPDMFEKHLPAKWADDAPRVVTEVPPRDAAVIRPPDWYSAS